MKGIPEQPQKIYIKYEDHWNPSGLHEDVKNIWSVLQSRAVSLEVANRKSESNEKANMVADRVARLNKTVQTYEEYVRERYAPSDVDLILEKSDKEKIEQNNSLVMEFNEKASRSEITPEIAREFMYRGLELFGYTNSPKS